MSRFPSKFSSLCIATALLLVSLARAQNVDSVVDSERAAKSSPVVAELTASDGVSENGLGLVVAASGTTVVAGENCLVLGSISNCDLNHQGVVYVYERPKSGWANMVQTAELTPSDGYVGDEFGATLAISDKTIVVGNKDGKAYVFVSPAGGWRNMTETAQLSVDTEGEIFEVAVAIDKDTIVLGEPNMTINGNQNQGAAFVFVKPQTGWATTSLANAELTVSDGSFQDLFGLAVAVSGKTILAGAPFHEGQAGPGEAYVFEKPKAGWANAMQGAILTRSGPGPFDEFGLSVALNGNTIVVGAPQAIGQNNGQGVVDIFAEPSAGWSNATETAELVAPISVQNFGYSVAIQGRNALVGTSSSNNLIFEYSEPSQGGWQSTSQPQAEFTASEGVSLFGYSVAITKNVIVAGAPLETVDGHTNQGATYVFSR